MNEALNDAKCNLAKAQEHMKRRLDKARRTEEWAVGDRFFSEHVELADVCTAFTIKAEETLGGPAHNRQGHQSNCLPVEFASWVADSSNISCQ